MYILPESMKEELRVPLGKLIKDDELIKELKNAKYIIAVGDITAITLFERGIIPNLTVVDFKTKRQFSKEIADKVKKIGEDFIKVENPAGTITMELWIAITTAYSRNKNTRIEINGEEDLAVIPCALLSPENSFLVYGLPDKGLVVMEITLERRKQMMEFLSRMVIKE